MSRVPKVLVIGSGGREHALTAAIARSIHGPVLSYPGNVGTEQLGGRLISIATLNDVCGLARDAQKAGVHLTIVGPEAPMAAGIAEEFARNNLAILAPSSVAAKLETSKVWAKEFMNRHSIPTARFEVFDDPRTASEYVISSRGAVVVKADGLCGGKGVYVCDNEYEARCAVQELMGKRVHGEAGQKIVIEERLYGKEVSAFYLISRNRAVFLTSAGDYKRAFDHDRGPNTGGMGAYSPHPLMDETLQQQVWDEVIENLLIGLDEEGIEYNGFLYVGLMVTPSGPKVLEFNVRLGDPEAQVLMPLWEGNVYEILEAAAKGVLLDEAIAFSKYCAVGVVMTTAKYPEKESVELRIRGPLCSGETFLDTVLLYHGATRTADKKFFPIATGGRILTAVGIASTYSKARERAYSLVSDMRFEGMRYRSDIASGLT